jgi:anti-sigma factor RsiW
MNCKKTQKLLSLHVDGRLSGHATWEVDRHLAECNACTHVANELRKTVAVVSSAPRFDAPTDFAAKLQQRLARVETAPRRRTWSDALRAAARPRVLPAWAAAATAVVLIAVLARGPKVTEGPVSVRPPVDTVVLRPSGDQQIALTASGPLDDVSASVLTAHYGQDYELAHQHDIESQD